MRNLIARALRPELALVLVIAFAVTRIVDSYAVFNHTWDEPAHLAAGLELLDHGTYTLEQQHPPLARAAMALGPFLDGYRSERPAAEPNYDFWERQLQMFDEGRRILYDAGPYDRVLTLARMGNLPFAAIAFLAVFLWTRRLAGPWPAVLSALLLATIPPFLGNAGLATLDVAVAALGTLSLYLSCVWIDRPTPWRGLLLGAVAGAAIMTKFSAIPFLTVGFATIAAWRMWLSYGVERRIAFLTKAHIQSAVLATLVLIGVFWLSYGLNTSSAADPGNRPYEAVEKVFGADSDLSNLISDILELQIVPGFVLKMAQGIGEVAYHNWTGHISFLLGEVRKDGWWYFYLVALGVKTPLPLLALGLAGIVWMLADSYRKRDWRLASPALALVSIILFVSIFSRINLGVRHILILYPLLVICGAYTVTRLVTMRKFRLPAIAVAAVLTVWQAAASLHAHPDNMAYFNAIAGSRPERLLIAADLDWGQDLKRLERELQERGIHDIAIAYYGSARLPRHNFPGYVQLEPKTPRTGWVAISLWKRELTNDYDWLKDYQPIGRVGQSIYLYHIPESQ